MKTILGDDEDENEEDLFSSGIDTDNLPILLTRNCNKKILSIFPDNL